MDTFSALRVALSLLLSLALVLDIVFLVFSFRHKKIGNRLCTRLLRSQTAIDSLLMLANLVNVQYFALLPVPGQSVSDSLWQAYCKLAFSQVLHWTLVCMSVYNLVCLAAERCCCLCAPMWYRDHQKLLGGIFIGVVAASPFVVEVPYCLLVAVYVVRTGGSAAPNTTISATTEPPWTQKKCEFTKDSESMMRGFGAAYVALFWVLPSALSVALYLCIMRKLRRSMALHKSMAQSGSRLDAAARRITLMTCVTSGAFVLLFAMDSIDYLLYCAGVNIEKEGILDSVDSFLLTLNSAVNPLLYLIFMPEFRSFVTCAQLRKRCILFATDDTELGPSSQTLSSRARSDSAAAQPGRRSGCCSCPRPRWLLHLQLSPWH